MILENTITRSDDKASSPLLFISTWREGGVMFLSLRGELDMHAAPTLRKAISEGLSDPTADTVAADMSAVTFVDSTGYGVFISAMQSLRFRGAGRVHLAACQAPVLRMLGVTRLDRVFMMHNSLDDLRESLNLTAAAPQQESQTSGDK